MFICKIKEYILLINLNALENPYFHPLYLRNIYFPFDDFEKVYCDYFKWIKTLHSKGVLVHLIILNLIYSWSASLLHYVYHNICILRINDNLMVQNEGH